MKINNFEIVDAKKMVDTVSFIPYLEVTFRIYSKSDDEPTIITEDDFAGYLMDEIKAKIETLN